MTQQRATKRKPLPSSLEVFKRKGVGKDPSADFARNIEASQFKSAFMSGRYIEVEFDNESGVQFEHGLGRPYRGGIVVWVSATQRSISVFKPHAPNGTEDLVGDPAVWCEVGCPQGAFTGTVGLWVF
jgi:hypothetical protein